MEGTWDSQEPSTFFNLYPTSFGRRSRPIAWAIQGAISVRFVINNFSTYICFCHYYNIFWCRKRKKEKEKLNLLTRNYSETYALFGTKPLARQQIHQLPHLLINRLLSWLFKLFKASNLDPIFLNVIWNLYQASFTTNCIAKLMMIHHPMMATNKIYPMKVFLPMLLYLLQQWKWANFLMVSPVST